MRRRGSPRVEGYALVAAAGLVAALALRRPELAVVAAPFALFLALGLRLAKDPEIEVSLVLEHERTLERTPVAAEIALRATEPVDRLEVYVDLPPDVEVVDGREVLAVRLERGEPRELPLELLCRRWGVYEVGDLEIRARDAFRVVVWERRVRLSQSLKAYPTSESVEHVLAPLQTQALTGSEVARTKGDGIEYADIRDYLPGDRPRAINWRASARRGSLVVNERHPERNTDVVLFLDSFSDLRRGDRSTLDDAVRAAATLATRYLERRDRVGLVSFGGVLRWLQPGMGPAQRFRLIEGLLETGVQPTYTWRNVNIIPARILPSQALLLALTPLVDPRFVTALQDLRARGHDLAVVEIDPVPIVEPGSSEAERIAYRLWLLQREMLRARLVRLGIAVARWGEDTPLDLALEEVRTFRRYARLARL